MVANRWGLRILIAVGIASVLYYFSWWVENGAITNPALLLLLLGMVLYLTPQALFVWYIYLHARTSNRRTDPALPTQTVDVFLPTYREPIELIEKTLRAVMAIRYPHTTYVIDDGNDDGVRAIALSLGARYLRRSNHQHHKAGNINNALKASSGDLVAIFDIDHVPTPDYLDRVIPYFDDPKLGVVQVALDHSNQEESFVAAAAGRMSDEFFAATMHGMDKMGCAVVFGSNAIFRRAALSSLGGYKPGLAEDLSTSVHLHATGWKSAYLPEILAKGLIPADLEAFYKQQFKWGRGVFEVLINEMPSLFWRLTGMQRICYATRMTYYLAGPVIAAHILVAIAAPFFPGSLDRVGDYFLRSLPFVLSFIAIHMHAYRMFALKPVGKPADLRWALLILASWPAYTMAFLSTLFRKEPRFVSTPKTRSERVALRWILPQLAAVLLLVGSLAMHAATTRPSSWKYALVVYLLILLHTALLPALRNRPMAREGQEAEPIAPQESSPVAP